MVVIACERGKDLRQAPHEAVRNGGSSSARPSWPRKDVGLRADDTRAAFAAPSWRRTRGSARSSLIGLLASGLFAAGVAAHEAPQRVASLNLCADQLVLQLADREQIASLSALAKDRSISFLADAVGGIPPQSESEVVLFDRIDLVLVGRYGTALKRSLLERHAVPVLVLDVWTDLAMGREQIRVVAKRLGHPERGEGLIAIDAAWLGRGTRARPRASSPTTGAARCPGPTPSSATFCATWAFACTRIGGSAARWCRRPRPS